MTTRTLIIASLAAALPMLGFAQAKTGTQVALSELNESVEPVSVKWHALDGQCGPSLGSAIETANAQLSANEPIAYPLAQAESFHRQWYPSLKSRYEKFSLYLGTGLDAIESSQQLAEANALSSVTQINATARGGLNGTELAQTGVGTQNKMAIAGSNIQTAASKSKEGETEAQDMIGEAKAAQLVVDYSQESLASQNSAVALNHSRCSTAITEFVMAVEKNQIAFTEYTRAAETEAVAYTQKSTIDGKQISNVAKSINGPSVEVTSLGTSAIPAAPSAPRVYTGTDVVVAGIGGAVMGGLGGYIIGNSGSRKNSNAPAAGAGAAAVNQGGTGAPVTSSSTATANSTTQTAMASGNTQGNPPSVSPARFTSPNSRLKMAQKPSQVAQKRHSRVMADSLLD